MKRFVIILVSLALFLGVFFSGWVASFIYTHPSDESPAGAFIHVSQLDPFKIYNLVNDFRSSKGLKKLVFDPSMCDFANTRLKEIHTDWSHSGFLPVADTTYKYNFAGENLAKGYLSEQETLDGWEQSPKHLEDMVDPNFTRTCVTTDIFGSKTYVVQEFASY